MIDPSASDVSRFLADEIASARQLVNLLVRTLDRIEAAAGPARTGPAAAGERLDGYDVPRLPRTFADPGPVDEGLRAKVLTFGGPVDVTAGAGPATPAGDQTG